MRRLTYVLIIAVLVLSGNSALGFETSSPVQTKQARKLQVFDRFEEFYQPKKPVAADTLVFSKYKAKVEVYVQEAKYGVMAIELQSTFTVGQDCQLPSQWYNVMWLLKIFDVQIDGVPLKFEHPEYDSNVLELPENKKIKAGTHTMKLKYHFKMYVSPGYYDDVRVQAFCGVDGFHLFNPWYFLPDNYGFTDIVEFDMDMSIPPNWFLCGSFVPVEYRDKPAPNGRYKFVSRTDAPFGYRILGGEYEVIKETVGQSNIRVYSFKNFKGDGPYIAKYGASCLEFFGDYYNHQSKGDYFIAQLRCSRGSGYGCEGGFAIDAPYLTKENFMPDFLAHEMAHVSWWGGDGVNGTRDQPHYRFMSEAFAEFSSFLFCEKRVSLGYYNYVIAKEESYYWEYCVGGAPLSNPDSAKSFPLTYYKGGLVINCLKSWMGEEAFQKGMRDVIDAYVLKDGQDPDNRPRCTQQVYKQIMEKAYGKALDDFWNVYFNSSDVPIPIIDVIKQKNPDGTTTDKLSFEYKGNDKLPVRAMVYFTDGTSQEFSNTMGKNVYELPKPCAGLENLTWKSLIHSKDTTYHSLGTSTVAAVINWRKPAVVCLDDDYSKKAEQWAKLVDTKVITSIEQPEEPLSVILVGPKAISTYASDAMKALPAKCVGDSYLEWYTAKFSGDFSMTTCAPNPKNSNCALILDLSTDGIPKDLSWTSYFCRSDKCFEIAYRSLANGILAPPKPDFLKIPWVDPSAKVYDCRYNLTFDIPKNYNLSYDGFDEKEFRFATLEKTSSDFTNSKKIILDLADGDSDICILRRNQNLYECWRQTQIYDGKGRDFASPEKLRFDRCSKDKNYMVSWSDSHSYLYRLDGKVAESWQSGNTLALDSLENASHQLDMVFINSDGLISKVQSCSFRSGQSEPKLDMLTKVALWKSKMVIIKGQTDPGSVIEPNCAIAPDGSFELTVPSETPISMLKITAANDCGYVTTKNVSVTKYVKFFLTLGSMVAKDYEGNSFTLQAPAQMVKGSTYVPMRFIGDQLGATVSWDANEKKVTYILAPKTVEIWIGKKTAKINGTDVMMPGPPVIVSNKTLVPLRFVGNALGAGVSWDKDTKTATVEYPQPQ